MVYKREGSKYWWYKFTWQGEQIRESTKQANKRVAEQMEAAHRTSLAKGEVGIREKQTAPTLQAFAETDFLPYVEATFAAKVKTASYYKNGLQNLLAYEPLGTERLDAINTERISGYVAKRQMDGLKTASINRELQVLRRMFALAMEWGKVEKVLPRVRMQAGEAHRERVLTLVEEIRYLTNATPLLRDVATLLLDCALRPEECFRLKWANVRDGIVEVHFGKTDNARRRIPLTPRALAMLEMRRGTSEAGWVFTAPTKSGHIEPSTLKKQHIKACKGEAKEKTKWAVEPFPLYTLRHTCLTRWAPHMDPWTLAHLAGHRDMTITKRYVHPQADTIRAAMERARTSLACDVITGNTTEPNETVEGDAPSDNQYRANRVAAGRLQTL